jgi:L-methionine (R)-S-oxide reductase
VGERSERPFSGQQACDYDVGMSTLADELRVAPDLDSALRAIISHFNADSGTIHTIADDGALHLRAASKGIPEPVLNLVRIVPIGKGMAGLAVQRREAVTVCNLQTDTSGDVRPGAKQTGLEGAIVVPMFDSGDNVVGTLGIANRNERTFTKKDIDALIECGRSLAQFARHS